MNTNFENSKTLFALIAFINKHQELPQVVLNKLRFAQKFAKIDAIKKFIENTKNEEWLNKLKNNEFTYSELFGKLDRYYVRRNAPYLLKNPGSSRFSTGNENLDRLEDRAGIVIDHQLPYGLDYNHTYTDINLNLSVSVYTSFNPIKFNKEDEEEIMLIDFKF